MVLELHEGGEGEHDSRRRLSIPPSVINEMIEHARWERPIECCGLLGGVGERVHSIYRLENEAKSGREYFAAAGLFAPFKRMRELGEELLAIYHSHPATPALPSATDLARNDYPETVHIIISLAGATPDVRAFLLSGDRFEAVDLLVEDGGE